jgi:hypothetical protein
MKVGWAAATRPTAVEAVRLTWVIVASPQNLMQSVRQPRHVPRSAPVCGPAATLCLQEEVCFCTPPPPTAMVVPTADVGFSCLLAEPLKRSEQ